MPKESGPEFRPIHPFTGNIASILGKYFVPKDITVIVQNTNDPRIMASLGDIVQTAEEAIKNTNSKKEEDDIRRHLAETIKSYAHSYTGEE